MLIFDPTKTNPTNMHNVIQNNLLVSNWWHYLPSAYILLSQHSITAIQNDLLVKLPNQRFMLTKIDPKVVGGWLPEEAWKWVRDHSS